MSQTLVTKAEFARHLGVVRSGVTNFIRRGQLTSPALVVVGARVLVDVDLALAQLRQVLDVKQRIANGRAQLETRVAEEPEFSATAARGGTIAAGVGKSPRSAKEPSPDPIFESIKRGRARQLELANTKAELEAARFAGKIVDADAARQELGRVAGRMIAGVEGALPELANAVAAVSTLPPRDALLALRAAWRGVRARLAGEAEARGLTLPEMAEAAQ